MSTVNQTMATTNAKIGKGIEHNYHGEWKNSHVIHVVVTIHDFRSYGRNTQIRNLKQFIICLDFDSIAWMLQFIELYCPRDKKML